MKILTFTVALFCLVLSAKAEVIRIQVLADFNPLERVYPENIATQFILAAASEVNDELSLKFIAASQAREWYELQKKEDVCLYNKLKTSERESNSIFSRYPIMASPAIKIIIYDKPNIPNTMTLYEAIYYYNLTIGITNKRSFSENIDNFIQQNEEHFFTLEGARSVPRLGAMLFQRKIDAVLDYSGRFALRFQNSPDLNKVRYITISDYETAVFGYIACSPSEIGKQAIDLFDKALKSSKVRKFISQRLMKLFPEGENTHIVNAFNAEFEH